MNASFKKAALCSATCFAALALVPAAYAQDAAKPDSAATASADAAGKAATVDDDATIVVTGSRLGSAAVTAQPVQALQGSSITDLGYTNIGQALSQLPGFGTPGNSNVGSQGSFGAGQTFVNMYDLGSQRTLTLVNGNRFVSSGSSSIFGAVQGSPVDLGQIAPGLVDHIDVVSVGGAPIYGSDAIAGTVNVILKKDYQGLSIDVSDGISGQGDARDYSASLLAGRNFDNGRGNITLNVYYDHQAGLRTSARAVTNGNSTFNGVDPTGTYRYARFEGGLHYSIFTASGMPLWGDLPPYYYGQLGIITNSVGQPLYFDKSGHLTVFHNGTALANGITEAGGDGFAINDYDNFLTDSQRIQGTLLTNYEFSDHLRFHGEFWLGRTQATNLAGQPYYSTAFSGNAGDTNGNLILSTDNPFLSAADQQTIKDNLAAHGQPTDTFYLARASTDLASGAFKTTTTLYRIVAGFDGDFSLGSHNFTWEATLNYGHVKSNTTSHELVTQNLFNALNAVKDGSGNIICSPGYTNASIATLSGTCAPLDIFGVGNESQAALDYITALAKTSQIDTQFDFVADVKGDLLTLPAGDVDFVLGYEHRRESQSFDPGAFFRGELQPDGSYVGYGGAVPITPVSGAYHTDEAFGELTVPIVSPDMNVAFVHDFNLHGAARYTNNSLTGGFLSYTGGATLAPIAGVSFRGNYTRSFRSPAVTELFAPRGSNYEFANDPCDARFINDGPNPTVRAANCAAAGLPSNFQSIIVDSSQQGTSAGNPTLQNEKAKSWTAGLVLAPRFIPGLKVSADYVSIDIANEITSPGLTSLMNACYDSQNYPNFFSCNTFTRDSSGQVVDFQDDYFNIAIEKFRGLQATLDYTLPLNRLGLPDGAGALQLSANWLHTYKHFYKVGTDDNTEVLNQRADPKDSVQGNIDWATHNFDWLWQVTYYGPTQVNPNAGAGTYQYPRISPYWMVNTSIGVKANENFQIRLIVNNVFNLGIPFPYTSYDQNKYYDAIMGRYFRLNAKVTF